MHRVLIQAALAVAPILTGGFSNSLSALPGGLAARGIAPENVEIQTTDGHTVAGSFFKPSGERAPGAILVHDAGASRAQLEPLAERLSKQGFAVLAIDLRGHGASKSPKLDWEQLSDADKKSTWNSAVQDVDAAAKWLLGQPGTHSTSLSLIGYGAGCALAVRHAKSDENVVCMALLAPNPEIYGFNVRADIQTIGGLPTFVVTSKDAEAERMAQEANASSGNPFVELLISPAKLANPLDDKALPGRVSKWLAEKAMPKKGGREKK